MNVENNRPYDDIDLFKILCDKLDKWGLYISFGWDDEDQGFEFFDGVVEATGGLLDRKDTHNALFNGYAYFLYDTWEDSYHAFKKVVGKDGPTDINPYDGPVKVFAMTVSNDGEIQTENA